jgi:hypothetical protein
MKKATTANEKSGDGPMKKAATGNEKSGGGQ